MGDLFHSNTVRVVTQGSKKAPPFATGAKLGMSRLTRRQCKARQLSDTVLQFTQLRARASAVAATLSVRQHRCLATFHYVKLYTGRGRMRSCDVKPGQY